LSPFGGSPLRGRVDRVKNIIYLKNYPPPPFRLPPPKRDILSVFFLP